MKSLMLFLRSVATDCGNRCGVSTQLDLKTVELRVKHEGLSFLTITLPNFGKEFERALDQGYVDNTMFTAFGRHRGLPRFLGGFLCQVFDFGTGLLLTDPSIDAIRSIRQITLLCGKMHALCSSEREYAAFAGYVDLDQKVGQNDGELERIISSGDPFQLERDSRKDVYARGDSKHLEPSRKAVLGAFVLSTKLLFREPHLRSNQRLHSGGVVPKHGPGSTADGLKGNLKYRQRIWTDRLESIFPFGYYAFPTWSAYLAESGLTFLDPGSELPSKVISVPKTMKTPRLIAVEPTCMQYVQQGLLRLLVEDLSQDKILWKMLGFDDQAPNQRFARKGSHTGAYATLDMSEASDRVGMWHVRTLFASTPLLLEAILACRSSKASVPGFGVLTLSKFASMGSALCFPVEAMVFLAAVFAGISLELNRPLTKKDIRSFSSQVRVFGDDIIVPTRFTHSVVVTLELLGFKVNTSKSFWTGKFRESCGKEYYDGHDVSIVKLRQMLPAQRRDTQEIVSAVSMRNQFFKAGFVETTEFLDGLIERFIPFPEVEETSPILGKLTWGPVTVLKWDPVLQKPLTRGVVVRPVKVRREIDGYPALMKWFLKDDELPFIDKDHLVYSGRPAALTLKACMASIR
jgi:hypothetical protein